MLGKSIAKLIGHFITARRGRDALHNSRRARRGFCGMSREAQNPRQGWRLAWFCNEVDRPQNHAPEGVRPKTGALPTKPLACALGTRRAVLASKSSRFGLERAWRELCRASLGFTSPGPNAAASTPPFPPQWSRARL